MAKEIRHIGIVVNNLEESLRFYVDLLGFKIKTRKQESGRYLDDILARKKASVITVKMVLPRAKQMVELIFFHSPAARKRTLKINDIGPTHLALTVTDVQPEYKRLKAAGVCFNSAPKTSPDGYAKVAFCRAPEGTFIELVEVL